MPISTRTRKNLWGKSANRCAICKTELFSENKNNEKSNIGEECHIISEKPNGPRFKPGLADYDSYDNLILLCRNHHRDIDEQIDSYNEEVLRYMKLNHEKWVQSTISTALNSQKEIRPKFLSRITSGKELLSIISDSHGYNTEYDEIETEEDTEYIGGVFQELIDCGDISGMVEFSDKVKLGLHLNELLTNLDKKGYCLFGESGIERVTFGNGESDNWSIATLIIKKKDNPEIIK